VNVLIVDDEVEARTNLRTILEGYCPEVEKVEVAGSAIEGLEKITDDRPDAVFLDIMMPGMSGLELAETLSHLNLPLAFVTGHDQFAIRAIKASAIDYVLKPVRIPELRQTIHRLRSAKPNTTRSSSLSLLAHNLATDNGPTRLKLPWEGGFKVVEASDIIQVKSDNTYSEVQLKSGWILVSISIGELEDMLHHNGFVRVHNSHLVNLAYLDTYSSRDGGTLMLRNKSCIPVSRRRLPVFRQMLDAYLTDTP